MLSVQHQTIIWTNAALLSIGLMGRNFSEICIKVQSFSVKKTTDMSAIGWGMGVINNFVDDVGS